MTFTGRIGRYFVLLGAVLLLIFFASDLAKNPHFNLFFWGFIFLVSGILLMRRGRLPPESSNRFRLIRSLRSRGKQRRQGAGGAEEEGEAEEAGGP